MGSVKKTRTLKNGKTQVKTRAEIRNPKVYAKMNSPQKAESMNRGYEFLQRFFERCQ